MYNGVGITTTRGSGSSGYVQSNRFNVRHRGGGRSHAYDKVEKSLEKKPNKDILEHERKRKIELEVFKLRDALEDEGVGEEEIERRAGELRKRLEEEGKGTEDQRPGRASGSGSGNGNETHAVADRKNRQMEVMAHALRVGEDHKEGEAFDRELQEQKKRERIELREQRRQEAEARRKEEDAKRQEEREERRRKYLEIDNERYGGGKGRSL